MNTQAQVDAARARDDSTLQHVLRDRERMRDALEHIANVCAGSRTSTRRLRWIATRCKSAVDDDEKWRDVDLPVVDPLVEKLRELLRQIFPIAAAELAALVDNHTTLVDEEERKGATFEELLESIPEPAVVEDCRTLREFLQGTRRNVPEINIEALRAGGDWIELT